MSNPKGRGAYKPEKGTIVYILYANGWKDVAEIAEHVEVSAATIRNWDRANNWPCWAIEEVGFTVKYGTFNLEGEARLKVEKLRDSLSNMLEQYET